MSNIVYLDNNATTMMPKKVINAMMEFINQGNPSASYASAKKCKLMMENFKQLIADICEFSLEDFYIIFNSGATEGNSYILRETVDVFSQIKNIKPHIITSSIEHKSIIETCKQLELRRKAEITFIKPDINGNINPKDIEVAIKSNTCLVSIMSANNEIGTKNDITQIGKIAHNNNVPFHTDAVQIFGKCPIKPLKNNVDAFTVSFHKLHGPPGIGIIVLKKKFADGYKLKAQICGSQNGGLRGGTENIINIAGSYNAFQNLMKDRENKNKKLGLLRKEFIKGLKDNFQLCTLETYLNYKSKNAKMPDKYIVIISPLTEDECLPNTILLSLIKTGKKVCNIELKKKLEEKGIIVSIGSACNTSSDKASHVLNEIGATDEIKRGTLRISFSDYTNFDEIKYFIDNFTNII